MSTTTHDESVDTLNEFLRGEISAVETYDKALDKQYSDGDAHPAAITTLRDIKADHDQVVDDLRARVRELGGEPDESSGAWGVFANAVQSTANLFGTDAAIHSLKKGEDHGLSMYQDHLNDLDDASRQHVERQILPMQRRHLQRLEALLERT